MKPKLKILPGAAIFFFAALTSFGQGTVKGKIHDEASNETLPGASILVQGESTGTVSRLDGSFSFDLDAGSYSLQISFVGYLETVMDVTVSDGQVTDLGNYARK
ncbi:MAG: carboxypeptidase-like regulatory domain-containing protein [Bacteroidetes bacterium]|nr:carboxypeptidase-like regulatory domain-containing protein [Bacteroidota bacterium]